MYSILRVIDDPNRARQEYYEYGVTDDGGSTRWDKSYELAIRHSSDVIIQVFKAIQKEHLRNGFPGVIRIVKRTSEGPLRITVEEFEELEAQHRSNVEVDNVKLEVDVDGTVEIDELTTRDRFAMAALTGMMANTDYDLNEKLMAKLVYKHADAMLDARKN